MILSGTSQVRLGFKPRAVGHRAQAGQRREASQRWRHLHWEMRRRISRAKGRADHTHWESEGASEPSGQSQHPWLRVGGKSPKNLGVWGPILGTSPLLAAWMLSTLAALLSLAGRRDLTFGLWNSSVTDFFETVCSTLFTSPVQFLSIHCRDPCRAQQFLYRLSAESAPQVNCRGSCQGEHFPSCSTSNVQPSPWTMA